MSNQVMRQRVYTSESNTDSIASLAQTYMLTQSHSRTHTYTTCPYGKPKKHCELKRKIISKNKINNNKNKAKVDKSTRLRAVRLNLGMPVQIKRKKKDNYCNLYLNVYDNR